MRAFFAVVTLTVLGVAGAAACSSSDESSLGGGRGSSGALPGTPTSDGGGANDDGATSADGGPGPQGDAGPGPSNGSTKPNCKYTAHKTGLTALQQAGGGLSFNVYAPASYDPQVGHTVVVLMHGQDSDGVAELTALWKPIADDPTQHLVLVAPKGSRPPTTGTTGANWATADLDKVLALMTEIDDCYDVFPKKHILWGFSEGGFYGYLLGIAAADRFSGLAMGGANTSFARQNGYPPSSSTWKIPVSDVHGTMDQNPISLTYQDRTDFQAAGHVFTLHEHNGGHTISPEQVRSQYDDLSASSSP
jgi:predicted esterase